MLVYTRSAGALWLTLPSLQLGPIVTKDQVRTHFTVIRCFHVSHVQGHWVAGRQRLKQNGTACDPVMKSAI